MLIAIHRRPEPWHAYADGWAASLEARGVGVRWIDLTAHDVLRRLHGCDGVMWHWSRSSQDMKVYRILNVIEFYLDMPVFPNHDWVRHRRDKLSQYYLFQAAGVPMPQTWVFWDKEQAIEWALQTDYPNVFKLSAGGGGNDVVPVFSSAEAVRLIDRMFGRGIYSGQLAQHLTGGLPSILPQLRRLADRCKAAARYAVQGQPPTPACLEKGYVYFQEFVPDNDCKTGIIVIGDRAFGYLGHRRSKTPNDFRTKSGNYDPPKIDPRCVQTAFDVSARLGFHTMAYDLLLHDNGPVVLEMNLRSGKTRGYWKRNLEWVSEPMSPQEAQVETFLAQLRAVRQDCRHEHGPSFSVL